MCFLLLFYFALSNFTIQFVVPLQLCHWALWSSMRIIVDYTNKHCFTPEMPIECNFYLFSFIFFLFFFQLIFCCDNCCVLLEYLKVVVPVSWLVDISKCLDDICFLSDPWILIHRRWSVVISVSDVLLCFLYCQLQSLCNYEK